MSAYYNEFDPFAAAWLRELIAAGLIAPGEVDERSIVDVQPSDLEGYTQCHFFAGAGGWSLALRMAGWADDVPVWTGSCPCQPFSNPGRKGGTTDERHLWPDFRRLIAERRPPVCFGEQVESPLGRAWLESVLADLEILGYAAAGAGLPAACVGAPQGRARLWWVADADDSGRQRSVGQGEPHQARQERTATRCEPVRSMRGSWPPGPREVDRIPLLANGLPGVVGACKVYGNAIVPEVAAEFIKAYSEALTLSFDAC